LQIAKDGGYDGVAWTTGKVQADRYNLSRVADEVAVHRVSENEWNISGFKDGETMFNDFYITTEQLENSVGKEFSSKILKDFEGKESGIKVYSNIASKLVAKVSGVFTTRLFRGCLRNMGKRILRKPRLSL